MTRPTPKEFQDAAQHLAEAEFALAEAAKKESEACRAHREARDWRERAAKALRVLTESVAGKS